MPMLAPLNLEAVSKHTSKQMRTMFLTALNNAGKGTVQMFHVSNLDTSNTQINVQTFLKTH